MLASARRVLRWRVAWRDLINPLVPGASLSPVNSDPAVTATADHKRVPGAADPSRCSVCGGGRNVLHIGETKPEPVRRNGGDPRGRWPL